jgi:hypothetical protein
MSRLLGGLMQADQPGLEHSSPCKQHWSCAAEHHKTKQNGITEVPIPPEFIQHLSSGTSDALPVQCRLI